MFPAKGAVISLLPRVAVRPLRALLIAVTVASLMGDVLATASQAASDKVLQRVKGVVGYQTAATTPLTQVFGKFLLPDDDFAVTQTQSAAVLALPDSSIVALGENTTIRAGAFDQSADGPGSTITVNGGSLRFDIHRPQGGAANYRFETSTSQIAVRGTIGLLSFLNGTTTVGCLVCAPDSVTVTVGSQTYALAAGHVLIVAANGTVVTGALTGTTLGSFSAAQVSTSLTSGPAAATAGIAPATAVSLPAAGAAAAGIGAVAAGVVAADATRSTPRPTVTPTAIPTVTPGPSLSPSPSPTLTPTPTPSPTPTVAPTISPTPTPIPTPTATASATVTITGRQRSVAAPESGPPTGADGAPGIPKPGSHRP